jgi:amino acid transporter
VTDSGRAPASDSGLIRALGVRAVAATAVNAIVGSGIFVLPAAVAAILGPAAPVSYIACAAVVSLTALSLAEAASRVPRTGGIYVYVETAFGRYPGFLSGFLYWLGSEVISNGAIAAVMVDALGSLVPSLAGPVARAAIIVASFAFLGAVNIRGVAVGARLIQLVTAAKLLPLLVVAIVGIARMNPANLVWHGIPSIAEFGRASLVLFFAFQGVETALSPSGEIRDPSRTIPRGLGLGLLVVTAFYAMIQLAAQGVLGSSLVTSAAPVAATAERLFGPVGLTIVAVATIISTFGTISGSMLTGPRLPYGLALDRLIPPVFGRLHPRFRTPAVAITVHCVASAAFALSGTFRYLAALSGIVTLTGYLLGCLATIVLRRRDIRAERPPFVLPGGPVIPIAAALVIVAFLANATRAEYEAAAWAAAVATVLYFVFRAITAPASE